MVNLTILFGGRMEFTKLYQVKALLNYLVQDHKFGKFSQDGSVITSKIMFGDLDSLSVLVSPDQLDFTEWKENFLSTYSENLKKVDTKKEQIAGKLWEDYCEFNNDNGELVVSIAFKRYKYKNLTIIFCTEDDDIIKDQKVNEMLKKIQSTLETPELETEIEQIVKRGKPSLIGPILAFLILGAMAAINFSLGNDALYALRSMEIPGVISGIVISIMAVAALFKKVKLTYFFMVFSLFYSLLTLYLTAEFDHLYSPTILDSYVFFEVGFLIAIAVRCKDFGYDSFKEFIGSVFAN